MASVQAKAIVLLDTDKRLVSLTTAGCPGVLLPIANRPILWYVLKNIEKSGIASAILVRGHITTDCIAASYQQIESLGCFFSSVSACIGESLVLDTIL